MDCDLADGISPITSKEPVSDISENCATFSQAEVPVTKLCKNCQLLTESKSSYRFSMANLEETHESELDIILGELNLLDQIICPNLHNKMYHCRSNSTGTTSSSIYSSTEIAATPDTIYRDHRTESPDNDSAFSDTLSLLSSESSASSSISSANNTKHRMCIDEDRGKAAKIQLALFKLEHATVKRLLVKAFTADGASKSVLVDERMTCGQVARMLADKNHVKMKPTWALVENREDLNIDRLYEDHELLVKNIMSWDTNSKTRLLFLQLSEKSAFFKMPEKFLTDAKKNTDTQYTEESRKVLIDEFFDTSHYLHVDGPLFLKNDLKKGWKKYHFVLRESGIYYFPKEKTKCSRDLVRLVDFSGQNLYKGIGWKKKFKSPNDHTFAIKSSENLSLKMLCAEDYETFEKWITAIRIAKYGKQLWHSYKILLKDAEISETNIFTSTKSETHIRMSSTVPLQSNSNRSICIPSSTGRVSRASSSSSSGCLSDDNGFDSEFTTGTIKRKPSMKPNIPLTTMTRQLKEVGEITICDSGNNTLTRRHNKIKNLECSESDISQKCQYVLNVDLNCSSRRSENIGELDFGSKNKCQTLMSVSSLDSLPPPPPPNDFLCDLYGSQTSISSLPLPPPPPPQTSELNFQYVTQKQIQDNINCGCTMETNDINGYPLLINSKKPAIKLNHKRSSTALDESTFQNQNVSSVSKTVSFADSPAMLRQKLCSSNESQFKSSVGRLSLKYKDMIPLSPYDGKNNAPTEFESPKKLSGSAESPPRDFLKDLQRVMRKKWQVAQKCKLEPATTPHEVLGFRDFSEEFCSNYTNFYRETANVSNWVQEHYGSGANFTVYENFNQNHSRKLPLSSSPSTLKKKRPPPPPPPKRSESTHLTHRF